MTVSIGTDLTARLPNTWLPMGKYAALIEASMQHFSWDYGVQVLVLRSTVPTTSTFSAQLVFPNLPTPNTTAVQLVLNVRLSERNCCG